MWPSFFLQEKFRKRNNENETDNVRSKFCSSVQCFTMQAGRASSYERKRACPIHSIPYSAHDLRWVASKVFRGFRNRDRV